MLETVWTHSLGTLLDVPFQLLVTQISNQPITKEKFSAFRHVDMVNMKHQNGEQKKLKRL